MSKKIMVDKSTELAQKLKLLRKKNGLTTIELGKLAQVSNSYISMLEAGERQPSRDVILRLGQAFFPEGNDEAALKSGILCFEVKGPEDTKKLIKHLLE